MRGRGYRAVVPSVVAALVGTVVIAAAVQARQGPEVATGATTIGAPASPPAELPTGLPVPAPPTGQVPVTSVPGSPSGTAAAPSVSPVSAHRRATRPATPTATAVPARPSAGTPTRAGTPVPKPSTPAPKRPAAPAAPPLRWVSLNDSVTSGTPHFDYTGAWRVATGTEGKFQGDDHFSNAVGGRAEVSFTGASIRLESSTAPHHGIAAISLDGGPEKLVDLFADPRVEGVAVYASPSLPYGPHTLRIRVTGDHSEDAVGATISVDRVLLQVR